MRSSGVYEQPHRSYEGLTRQVYRNENQTSMENAVLRYFDTPQIRRIVAAFRGMEASLDHSNCIYDRAALLLFCVVSLVLRKNRRRAHRFVQESDRLRAAVGLPPLSPELRHRLDTAEDDEDVPEAGFPTRQMISEFVNWVERWLSINAGRLDGIDSLNFMRREAYEESIVDVLARHPDIRTDFAAIDAKRIPSPNGNFDRKRPDPGANRLPKGKRKTVFGRQKFTAALGDVPLVFYSAFNASPSELAFCQSTFVPELTAHVERLRDRVGDAPALAGLNGAQFCGDGALANSKVIEELYRHNLVSGFRLPNGLVREVIGYREELNKRTRAIVMLDACNNGDHFCPCDAIRHDDNCTGRPDCKCRRALPHERTAMRQTISGRGIGGGVHVRCKNAACSNKGIRFFVPFSKPDFDKDRNPIAAPRTAYDIVLPLWRGDIRYHATVFKATQAIEQYHGHLYSLLGLSTENALDGRRFYGDFAHYFWFTLADLIWNLTIGFNLDRMKKDNRKRPELDWITLWQHAVRQWHDVWNNTDGQRQPDETERDWLERRKHPPHIGHYFLGSQQIC